MGAAGDMLTAAMLELQDEPESVLATLNSLFEGKAVLTVHQEKKCGIVIMLFLKKPYICEPIYITITKKY